VRAELSSFDPLPYFVSVVARIAYVAGDVEVDCLALPRGGSTIDTDGLWQVSFDANPRNSANNCPSDLRIVLRLAASDGVVVEQGAVYELAGSTLSVRLQAENVATGEVSTFMATAGTVTVRQTSRDTGYWLGMFDLSDVVLRGTPSEALPSETVTISSASIVAGPGLPL
jgi:hypothetical protein